VLSAFLKIAVASVVMAFAALEAERVLHVLLPGRSILVQAVRVFAAIGVGLVVLTASAMLLKVGEFAEALRVLRQRFRRTPVEM